MKLLLLSIVVSVGSLVPAGTGNMAVAIYSAAAAVTFLGLLIFVLILRRDVAFRVEWSKDKKKFWFERLPRRSKKQG